MIYLILYIIGVFASFALWVRIGFLKGSDGTLLFGAMVWPAGWFGYFVVEVEFAAPIEFIADWIRGWGNQPERE